MEGSALRPDIPAIAEIELSLPEQFEKIVRQFPSQIAIKTRERVHTYADLNATANRIARAILERRGGEPKPVALLFPAGPSHSAAMLGVLKAGKFFVSLDPTFPMARIAGNLQNSQAEFVIADHHTLRIAHELAGSTDVIALESIDNLSCADNLELRISPSALACIVYTSGSTGQAKGVVWDHRGLLHKARSHINLTNAGAADRVSLLTSGTGNAITTTLFTLLSGATLLPFNIREDGLARLGDWFSQEKISIGLIPPPVFRKLCESFGEQQVWPDLRILRLTGESVYKSDFELYRKHLQSTCTFLNALSSTETGPVAACRLDQCVNIEGNDLPVGYPMPGVTISVLNDEGLEANLDEVGEITIRSAYLSRGYWHQSALTDSKFKTAEGSNETAYFSGDLGLKLPDGLIIHKGRKDFRVKVRGHGVDITEVEKTMMSHPAIREAAVVLQKNDSADSHLIAYFSCGNRTAPTVTQLRMFLRQTLADFMVPFYFVKLDALPLTPSGKFDRKALPPPDYSRPGMNSSYVSARNETEKQLVRLWEQFLQIHPIGVHDDFFDLGGYSLVAAQLLVQVHQHFGLDLPVTFIAKYPTIAQMAAALKAGEDLPNLFQGEQPDRYFLRLQSETEGTPVFCFSYEGNYRAGLLKFARLNRLIGSHFCFYGVRASGSDGASMPHRSVREMALAYIEAIKAIQPHGPYILIGECGNGFVAYETARQLEMQNEKIGLLLLLDSRGFQSSAVRYYFSAYLWCYYFPRFAYRFQALAEFLNWRFLKSRLTHHLKEIHDLRMAERWQYIRGKGRVLLRSTTSAATAQSARPVGIHPTVKNTTSLADSTLNTYRLYSRYRLTILRYKPARYSGAVILIANEEWLAAQAALGWTNDLIPAGVTVCKIPGNHDTYITRNIHIVATVMKGYLERAASRTKESSGYHGS